VECGAYSSGVSGKRKKQSPQRPPYGAEPAALLTPLNAFSLKSQISDKPHAEYYTGWLNFTIVKLFNWGGEIQINNSL